jgi:hypothetical protein
VTNNSRFLILLERSAPNLASKVLRLTLDWAFHRLGELSRPRVLVMETFEMSPGRRHRRMAATILRLTRAVRS